ncbi:hypothetical protein DL98DRAFT_555074 [Cadophora sp. DSE1049]|nr:hypothetical protein DL98DRAFT_555074 [Cadophora sp. DSE1049]
MSQSMGWADNIIVAMAPLGIITAIVGAIRVGGPSWLRAIIGRTGETRAAAETELMSYTSHEVCELWNGQEIVRVMGKGLIREFIVLLPEGSGESREMLVMQLDDVENKYLPTYKPTIRDSIFGKHFRRGQDPETALLGLGAQELRDSSKSKNAKEGSNPEHGTGLDSPSVIIVRNTAANAPNLTLNAHSQFGRGELYLVAVFAAGTLLLVAGMLICSHVVENSTLEVRYCPVAGRRAYVIWLQRAGTVNDQAFESCAIFPREAQTIITTSQRAATQQAKVQVEEVKAVTGTLVSLCGFVVQFIGLREMHWSASIAQLVATGMMTGLRAWARRNLAELPESRWLSSNWSSVWELGSQKLFATGSWNLREGGKSPLFMQGVNILMMVTSTKFDNEVIIPSYLG